MCGLYYRISSCPPIQPGLSLCAAEFHHPVLSLFLLSVFSFPWQDSHAWRGVWLSGRYFSWPCRDINTSRWGRRGSFWDCFDWFDCFQGFTSPHTDSVELIGECFHSPWRASLKCNTLLTSGSHLYIHLSVEAFGDSLSLPAEHQPLGLCKTFQLSIARTMAMENTCLWLADRCALACINRTLQTKSCQQFNHCSISTCKAAVFSTVATC